MQFVALVQVTAFSPAPFCGRGFGAFCAVQPPPHGHSSAWATLLTVCWYAVPACGALAWIVVGFGDVRATSGRVTAAAAVIVTVAIDAYFVAKLGTRAGPGVYTAAAGALTLATTAVVPDFAH